MLTNCLIFTVLTGKLFEEKKADKEKQRTSYHDDVMEVLSAKKIREYLKYGQLSFLDLISLRLVLGIRC